MQCPFRCRLSELKRYVIYDANGQDIGEPIDFGLNMHRHLLAEVLIIGGGVVEEILEALEIRQDIDEFVYFNQIKNIEQKRINLTIAEKELQKTNTKGELPNNLVRFQELLRKKVYNHTNEVIGEIIDLYVDSTGTYLILLNTDFNATMRFSYNYEQRFIFRLPVNKLDSLEPMIIEINLNEITTYILNNYKKTQIGTTEIALKIN